MPHVVLRYTLAPDYLARRDAAKEAHMRHVERSAADGALIVAGAFGMPPAGAMFVFTDERSAHAFAGTDPYVESGVVVEWTVAPWFPVVGPGAG